MVLKQHIWDAARDTIQEWTGEELTQCSLYGIRVYQEGSILATHVDRLPLVSSAIINVAQDVDEPWYVQVLPWCAWVMWPFVLTGSLLQAARGVRTRRKGNERDDGAR